MGFFNKFPIDRKFAKAKRKRFWHVNSEVLMISRFVGGLSRDLVLKNDSLRFHVVRIKMKQQKLLALDYAQPQNFFGMNRLLSPIVNGGYLEVIQI